jgi:hypothetical protein
MVYQPARSERQAGLPVGCRGLYGLRGPAPAELLQLPRDLKDPEYLASPCNHGRHYLLLTRYGTLDDAADSHRLEGVGFLATDGNGALGVQHMSFAPASYRGLFSTMLLARGSYLYSLTPNIQQERTLFRGELFSGYEYTGNNHIMF